MNNYLLIVSCSQRKDPFDEPIPAVNRYDGPTYRCLRKMWREGKTFENLDILIISAKYGLLPCQQPIENYDQKMTLKRAEELRPRIQACLGTVLATTSVWKPNPYDQVFINLGKTYAKTLEGFHWGTVSTLEVGGGIGLKTQQMKAWLERIYQEQEVH